MFHGNANENDLKHHLYAIDDLQEDREFKFGISDDPIEEDGLSKRARDQRDYCNLVVGWLRFAARIILFNIPNREDAKRIEDEYMDAFEAEHGHLPRGNKRRNRKR
jgi:hypothetical protein